MTDLKIFKSPDEKIRLHTKELLQKCGLRWESVPDETVLIYRDGCAVATGSRRGRVLQYLAVAKEAEGEGLAEQVVSALTESAFAAGIFRLFLFTKPMAATQFLSMGYSILAETGSMVMMESSAAALPDWLASLPRGRGGVTGAIVANANPFTRGHAWLMERAAAECDTLHVFVLSEDASRFSSAERLEMVSAYAGRFDNVLVHPGGDYIISSATFPSYFLKDAGRIQDAQMELDAALFARRIAPALGITKRFVGSEPYCPVTSAYNGWLHRVLPRWGVEVVELERLEGISASRVRALLDEGNRDEVRKLVPEESYAVIQRKYA
ncbi:MAG: [citrate (pro-3S)-lyase] ligase [Ruminococcaceae bacterium]|nr:[citrate (pro-3S)-lyase] ligase [Oscillospiraceae bacterium]